MGPPVLQTPPTAVWACGPSPFLEPRRTLCRLLGRGRPGKRLVGAPEGPCPSSLELKETSIFIGALLSGVVFWGSQLSLQADPPAQSSSSAQAFGQGLLSAGCLQPRGGAVSHLLRNLGLRPPGRAGALGNRGMRGGPPGPRRTPASGEDGGPLQGWLWEGRCGVSSAPAESCPPSGHACLGLCPAPPRPDESPKLGTYTAHQTARLGCLPEARTRHTQSRGLAGRPGAAALPAEDRRARAGLSVHHSRKWKCS